MDRGAKGQVGVSLLEYHPYLIQSIRDSSAPDGLGYILNTSYYRAVANLIPEFERVLLLHDVLYLYLDTNCGIRGACFVGLNLELI